MDLILQAIVEPRRRDILRLIQHAELSSGEIAAHFDVTRPAISQHLQVLAAAGLVNVRRDGTKRLYQVRREGLNELRRFLEEFWDDSLDRLKQAAEAEERRLEQDDTATPRPRGS
jgi:DNA-binding transcriptional ArsR family regulator